MTDFSPEAFTTMYKSLCEKARSEWPATPGASDDTLFLLQPLRDWLKFAVDGELGAFSGAPGDILRKKEAFDESRDILKGIGDRLVSRWSGEASREYVTYLNLVQSHLGYFAGDSENIDDAEGYLPEASGLLDAAFAVQAARKNDLHQLGMSLDSALDRLDEGTDVRAAMLFCGKVAELAIGQLPNGKLGLDVVRLLWGTGGVASGAPTQAQGGDSMHIDTSSGTLAVGVTDVMWAFQQQLNKVMENYRNAVNALNGRMDRLFAHIDARNTADLEWKDHIPSWEGKSGLTLAQLLSLANATAELADKAGNTRAPEMPPEKKKEEHRPPGPLVGH
ncbi:hypothetical protein ACFQ05_15590 [Amycolatopsis umgeniensis]|uniref:Uncharacterized protein n=1 Tax=Amycolatopsis umgeniensis TaxID=336628 RepID=A0A841B779_9PSEU|nr:hypothetical protein [Amycolatopsis umgeniensis]MBB5854730.1 hypothetical protein [Amycolatopsis umgeniensis]